MVGAHSPEHPPASWKAASLCFAHYGNSPYAALIREPLAIGRALEGYSRTVLLIDRAIPPWAALSQHDMRRADHVGAPTAANFFKYIVQLATDGYMIDLFLFAHGAREAFGAQGGLSGDECITADDIRVELDPAETGLPWVPIRIVWGTNCYGQTLGETWRSVGALAAAGARYVNFYPNAWENFIAAWNTGAVSFGDAIARADTERVRRAAQEYIANVDAPAKRALALPDCRDPRESVIGDAPCAREYFVSRWLAPDEWQIGMSGAENMAYSSYMFRRGETKLTKSSRPSWL